MTRQQEYRITALEHLRLALLRCTQSAVTPAEIAKAVADYLKQLLTTKR